MLRRNNKFDIDYGNLKGVKFDGVEYTYINNSMVGDGLLWNGSTITGPAFINCFSFGTSSTTTIATQSTWYKLNVTTTEGFSRDGFSHSSNRITNMGRDRIVKGEAIVSLSSGNNNVIHLAFYKNGDTIIPCSEQDVVTSSGGRLSAVPIQCLIELDNDDFIEVWTKNESATNSIITEQFNLIVTEM